MASTSKKRGAADLIDASARKVAKVHPFFTKNASSSAATSSKTPGAFQWQPPLGSEKTCLHATNLSPKATTRVACFDLDGTLIKGKFNSIEWEWWRGVVPGRLRAVHQEGYTIVIISNQNLKSAALTKWKEKVQLIAAAIPDIPFRLFAATSRDYYRKPMIGMWAELETIFAKDGVSIDKAASYFVGDAAGRIYSTASGKNGKNGKEKKDFASSDRKWAINVGVPFQTPEEYFLNLPPHPTFRLEGFDPSKVPILPLYTPTSTPLIPSSSSSSRTIITPAAAKEMIVFAGSPALGKSTFFRRHLAPAGYVHVNQDTLGTRKKCLDKCKEVLGEGGGCVVDNTNRDIATRKLYVDLAKEIGVPVRCFHFIGSPELAQHNNLYRAFNLPPSVAQREPTRTPLPPVAFTSFASAFEPPTLEEGFSEIRKINWVWTPSEESTEEEVREEKRRWGMWTS